MVQGFADLNMFSSFLKDILREGTIALWSAGLGALDLYVQFRVIMKEKGGKIPALSAAFYIATACAGGFLCNLLIPLLGFFLGFALTLKLLLGRHISFFAALSLPTIFALIATMYFFAISFMLKGLREHNILMMLVCGLILGALIFFRILGTYAESEVMTGAAPGKKGDPETGRPGRPAPRAMREDRKAPGSGIRKRKARAAGSRRPAPPI